MQSLHPQILNLLESFPLFLSFNYQDSRLVNLPFEKLIACHFDQPHHHMDTEQLRRAIVWRSKSLKGLCMHHFG